MIFTFLYYKNKQTNERTFRCGLLCSMWSSRTSDFMLRIIRFVVRLPSQREWLHLIKFFSLHKWIPDAFPKKSRSVTILRVLSILKYPRWPPNGQNDRNQSYFLPINRLWLDFLSRILIKQHQFCLISIKMVQK